jgi:hypothetical protein
LNIVENIKLDQSASGENIEMNEMFSGDSISDPGVLGASSKPGEYLDLDMDKLQVCITFYLCIA